MDELRNLAEKAKVAHDTDAYLWSGADHTLGMGPEREAFVAAASPDVVIGLLDRLDAVEAAARETMDECARNGISTPALRAVLDEPKGDGK